MENINIEPYAYAKTKYFVFQNAVGEEVESQTSRAQTPMLKRLKPQNLSEELVPQSTDSRNQKRNITVATIENTEVDT